MNDAKQPLEGLPPLSALPTPFIQAHVDAGAYYPATFAAQQMRAYAEAYAREALRAQAASAVPVRYLVTIKRGCDTDESVHKDIDIARRYFGVEREITADRAARWMAADEWFHTPLYASAPPSTAHVAADMVLELTRSWEGAGGNAADTIIQHLKAQHPTPSPAQAVEPVGSVDRVAWCAHHQKWRHEIWEYKKIPFGSKLYASARQPQAQQGGGEVDVMSSVKVAIFATPDEHLTSRDILIHNISKALATKGQS